MVGYQDFLILSNIHDRETLMEHAKVNGVKWEEDSHEGVNWMRASGALVRHLENGKEFITDGIDEETASQMIQLYENLREIHKKTMVPILRSAMLKIHSDSPDKDANPMDLIQEAHEHLYANGGRIWADKIYTLRHLNKQIQSLSERVSPQDTEPQ